MYLIVLGTLIAILIYIFFSGEAQKALAEQKRAAIKSKEVPQTIVTFKGKRYNITSFIKKHPGGEEALKDLHEKDIEQLMLDNEHSVKAYQILEKYVED